MLNENASATETSQENLSQTNGYEIAQAGAEELKDMTLSYVPQVHEAIQRLEEARRELNKVTNLIGLESSINYRSDRFYDWGDGPSLLSRTAWKSFVSSLTHLSYDQRQQFEAVLIGRNAPLFWESASEVERIKANREAHLYQTWKRVTDWLKEGTFYSAESQSDITQNFARVPKAITIRAVCRVSASKTKRSDPCMTHAMRRLDELELILHRLDEDREIPAPECLIGSRIYETWKEEWMEGRKVETKYFSCRYFEITILRHGNVRITFNYKSLACLEKDLLEQDYYILPDKKED